MELEDFVNVYYRLDNVEDVESYCEYMGFNSRKQAKLIKKNQYVYLKHTCCGYGFNLYKRTGLLRIKLPVKPNTSFREFSWNNGFCQSSLQMLGNKIIHTQNGRKQIVTVREFFEDGMKAIITVDKSVMLTKYYVMVDK
ncbi:hypothetical protein ACKWTF_013385 [Chironomus riparius]